MLEFSSYKPEGIKAGIVEKEGNYLLKIEHVTQDSMQDGTQYIKVDCVIKAPGYPRLNLFLTEGRNFNAISTAFFDTFGIERGNFIFNSWIGHKGTIKITLKQKGEYTNMVPHYLVNEDGFVVPQQGQQMQQPAQPPMQQQTYTEEALGDDIPF